MGALPFAVGLVWPSTGSLGVAALSALPLPLWAANKGPGSSWEGQCRSLLGSLDFLEDGSGGRVGVDDF